MKSVIAGVVVLMGLVIAAFAVQPETKPVEPAKGVDQAQKGDAAETAQEEEKLVYFQMTTSQGEIYLELNNELAPISTQNFLTYVEEDYYNGTIFHRVIENFMIQGGGFTEDMKKKDTKAGIENEWTNGLSNVRGSIAMARVGGQADSGTSQFFINVKHNDFLDKPQPDGAAYAVFGRVVKGMDVVDKIRVVRTGMKQGMRDVPVETVLIEKIVKLDSVKVEELGLAKAED